MTTASRRYDIDWIRVIAIGLLLIYHVAIGFQPWGMMIAFITTPTPWESLWPPMAMLNVWRIPLLFFVSGMGVYFAMQNRNWKSLLGERAMRILVPFVLGCFIIVPIHVWLWQRYYNFPLQYTFGRGHLWFLGNIFVYVLLWLPFFYYLLRHERANQWIRRVMSHPAGLIPFVLLFQAEVWLVRPGTYEMYAMTWHGFYLGLVAFLAGFCFVLGGEGFRQMTFRWRWLFVAVGAGLYTFRWAVLEWHAPGWMLSLESNAWVLSVLAFGFAYLNRPGKVLRYLSQAAYPIYILHMIFLYLGATWIFPLALPSPVAFMLILLVTLAGCFLTYEIIRRISFLRPLLGLKP
jgi:glucan biosynthesis protein C